MTRWVYFIRAASPVDLIKIGCTTMPKQRLSALHTWVPVKLTIEAMAPGDWSDEQAVQAMFHADHSHGEWFRASPALNAFIDNVAATGELPELPALSAPQGRVVSKGRALAYAKQSVLLRATSAEKAVHKTYAPVAYRPRPDFRPVHVHEAMERWSVAADTTVLSDERETILAYVTALRSQDRAAA